MHLFAKSLMFLFLLVFVISCDKDQQSNSNGVTVPEDTLIDILTDIHLADAYMSVKRTERIPFERKDLYESILKEYSISRSRFDSTINYYTTHVDRYELLYEKVMMNLSALEADASAELQKKKQDVKDSLTLKMVVNTESVDTVTVKSKEFIKKALDKRDKKEEEQLKSKKAPRL